MLNTVLNNYFGFNRQQRNGLFVLMLISLSLLAVRLGYPGFIEPGMAEIKNLPLFEARIDSALTTNENKGFSGSNTKYPSSLFVFNPNKVTQDQLLKLGFSEKTAKRFVKFRSKGFKFKNKKDLLKVYGVSEAFYAKLEPYILTGEEEAGNPPSIKRSEPRLSANKKESTQPTKLELNSADSLALLELRGIGPSFAKRILKYRNLLGGYVSVEQLKEVYGFTDELFSQVHGFFSVNISLVKKINLNKDDFKTVNKHPYLSYELTKAIFNQRRKAPLTQVAFKDLVNDETLYQKVLPYLLFE